MTRRGPTAPALPLRHLPPAGATLLLEKLVGAPENAQASELPAEALVEAGKALPTEPADQSPQTDPALD